MLNTILECIGIYALICFIVALVDFCRYSDDKFGRSPFRLFIVFGMNLVWFLWVPWIIKAKLRKDRKE